MFSRNTNKFVRRGVSIFRSILGIDIMADSAQIRKEFREWQKRYDATAPKAGDFAPDFELRDANGEDPVRLTDFRGVKPVALIFGSFT
jgi:hypothetical protein